MMHLAAYGGAASTEVDALNLWLTQVRADAVCEVVGAGG